MSLPPPPIPNYSPSEPINHQENYSNLASTYNAYFFCMPDPDLFCSQGAPLSMTEGESSLGTSTMSQLSQPSPNVTMLEPNYLPTINIVGPLLLSDSQPSDRQHGDVVTDPTAASTLSSAIGVLPQIAVTSTPELPSTNSTDRSHFIPFQIFAETATDTKSSDPPVTKRPRLDIQGRGSEHSDQLMEESNRAVSPTPIVASTARISPTERMPEIIKNNRTAQKRLISLRFQQGRKFFHRTPKDKLSQICEKKTESRNNFLLSNKNFFSELLEMEPLEMPDPEEEEEEDVRESAERKRKFEKAVDEAANLCANENIISAVEALKSKNRNSANTYRAHLRRLEHLVMKDIFSSSTSQDPMSIAINCLEREKSEETRLNTQYTQTIDVVLKYLGARKNHSTPR